MLFISLHLETNILKINYVVMKLWQKFPFFLAIIFEFTRKKENFQFFPILFGSHNVKSCQKKRKKTIGRDKTFAV